MSNWQPFTDSCRIPDFRDSSTLTILPYLSSLQPINEVWGKVIFSVACVKNSVHRGVCLSACWDTTPPKEQTPPNQTLLGVGTPPGAGPPRADTPLGAGTLPVQCMLGDTVNKWVVCILLECNLVVCCVSI